jgi:hypothetical protein
MVNFSQEQTSGLSCAASPSTLPLSLLPGRSVSPCDEQCGVTLHPGFRVAVSHMADGFQATVPFRVGSAADRDFKL